MSLSLTAKFEQGNPQYNDILRIVCHHAIENIPDKGLNELCETLGDMLEFYSDRGISTTTDSIALTSTETAIAGNEYMREQFYYVED